MLLPLYVSLKDVLNSNYDLRALFETRDLYPTIGRSLLLASLTAIGGAFIAVPQAYFLSRYKIPMKKLWLILCVLPLVFPSYISAYSYLAAFDNMGFYENITGWKFPFKISGSLFGTWMSMTLVNSPLIFLMTYAALQRQSPSCEESARLLGSNSFQIFTRITLPSLKIPIASGMLLVCLYTLSDFGTPSILNYKTLTYYIFQHLDRGSFDRASFFALILIVIAFFFLQLEVYMTRRRSLITDNKSRHISHYCSPLKTTVILSFFSASVFLSCLLPLATILYWFSKGKSELMFNKELFSAASNSSILAVAAAIIATLFAIPTAWCAIRKKGLFGKFADRISFLGNMFPGLVIGLAFVSFFVSFNIFGYSFYQTLWLPILGCAIRFLPQAVSSVKTSLVQINPRLEEASQVLGHSDFHTKLKITAPLLRPGVLAGFALVFISTLKELPITLLLAEPGKFYLTQNIWNLIDDAEYSRVAAPALLLLGISCISLYFILNQKLINSDD
ncbi:iron ABC transporter permease [Lentisphaera profundi]|uniref:Iron ABC transporter permease n=1 Tax=Lentisphaera profundi TaxID=1658616 RepID=A0ABY7W2I2_9BACT|nr:iron ABC transporter permease [Lentisphaera profundi]WDE99174.1 iron ABC transporter permease [Lentisphaera profundi]